jgi:dipeptidase E
LSKLLLLSNSTNYQEKYMQWCKSIIAYFINGHSENILFVPYAAVGFSYQEYTDKVNDALRPVGVQVNNLDNFEDKREVISNASAIFVGGGNTFHLLKSLQDLNLVNAIQEAVTAGIPYAGWSAGSNIAGPTICTTNDMPIVQPSSFNALHLIPFQLNPHYTEAVLDNHGGETRKQRLEEYLVANQYSKVICLPEATYLEIEGDRITYKGSSHGKLLSKNEEQALIESTLII